MAVKRPSTSSRANEEKQQQDIEHMNDVIKAGETSDLFGSENNVFKMLYGYRDEEGTVHTEFEVRDIDGRDTEAIHKADVKSNASKIVTTLLSRCVTRIGTIEQSATPQHKWIEIIRNLYVGDQDFMMLCLRRYSISEEISVEHQCPSCKAKLKTTLHVDEVEVRPFITEEIEFDLPRGYTDKKGEIHKEGVMRLPKGIDREVLAPIVKTNVARAETVMLTRIMKFGDGYPIDDSVTAALILKDREYLTKLQQEFYFGLNLDIEITCDTCGETFTGSLNATNFL